eukprot:g9559.t1
MRKVCTGALEKIIANYKGYSSCKGVRSSNQYSSYCSELEIANIWASRRGVGANPDRAQMLFREQRLVLFCTLRHFDIAS